MAPPSSDEADANRSTVSSSPLRLIGFFKKPATFKLTKSAIEVSGPLSLKSPVKLEGLFPAKVPPGSSIRVLATFPDGHVEPLLWLYEYEERFAHPFWLSKVLTLPAGTKIQGVPPGTRVFLLPD